MYQQENKLGDICFMLCFYCPMSMFTGEQTRRYMFDALFLLSMFTGEQTRRYMFHASLCPNGGQTDRLYFGSQEPEKDGRRRTFR